ncbi:TPM domain-containing protein [Mycobacterium parmense]|uniref:Uncharacterized protein n=1 Tax=Mycobacterium parmense TaxID=185642 RepID=A0A7I7YN62_9MYCO|nr:TPM domain-containing protein [Mycobacterium parmense]MCV7353821.1 TPM domain-containing protein [Mycobacterium parmense]ORW58062.1 hypothetical protein AWC20_12795 [Mycobacterium parmense]BBZ43305.1 hypothetical protein MPRM_05860 [Mycobacterium parmense]
MRTARLLGVMIVTLGLGGGLLLAPTARAEPPLQLTDYVTDDVGALSASGRATVTSAVDKLYADRHIRLWVVYVDNFSGLTPESWAQQTRRASDLRDYDALLAVATTEHAYAFLVPSEVKSVTASQVDDLRRNKIEPALHNRDWSGAAVAAADGLNRQPGSSGRLILLVTLLVIALAVAALLIVMRLRRRRRRSAGLAAARRLDPTDASALAGVPLDVLDDLSRSMVVDVDNAVRTSANELELAVEEFGEERTRPFSDAVNNAKAALAQAFTVRQQLDDATPETPEQRRQLLTQVIVSAARADRELESQTEAFEKLRDLVLNASSRLDGLTQQYVELTTRLGPAVQRLSELHKEFDDAALTSVSGNVGAAEERLQFADRNISSARDLAARALSGQQSGLVDAVRGAESALGQARALLDAVDNADRDIKHAVESLPALLADIRSGVGHANELLRTAGRAAHTGQLAAARDAAASVAEGSERAASDPLALFGRLSEADAALNRALATVAEEQADAERLSRSLDQALFTAQSRVRAVSDYIDARRGTIGPEARTRLAEAGRHVQAALDKRSVDVNEAIAHANAAATLAANAQSLANADVQAAQQTYTGRGGSDIGAMMGGIIIGDMLGGGMRGGFGGWSPASFGGSPGAGDDSYGGGFDDGFMGGGGRF